METINGPLVVREAGTVLENVIIYGEPTDDTGANDYTLKIVAEDVILRNVIVYHAANTIGIYGW